MAKNQSKATQPPQAENSPLTGPMLGRREFFHLTGAGVGGFFLTSALNTEVAAQAATGPTLVGKARNCIFILLPGAPSHTDTFDLKVGPWTPSNFNPTSYNGVMFPQGLLPNLAEMLDKFAIVRSLRAPALVHPLQQTWAQIARSPSSALGTIAPNLGSVVSLEFEAQRRPEQKLPVFVSLNTGGSVVGAGYFNGVHAPFDVTAAPAGVGLLANSDGQATFNARYQALTAIDARYRTNSPLGDDANTMAGFYTRGRSMMYDPAVDAAFKFTTDEQQRYGNNGFGNSCLVARNLMKANLGTRYVQINLGGWDNHQDIYEPTGIYGPARALDVGVSNLLRDLAAAPGINGGTTLDETLVVWMGEFGRTVGALTDQDGRDHFFQHFACFAGGGVRGGAVIGQTTATGASVEDPGWSAGRPATYEDVAATIYSALGIDYTTTRRDDPFGRGFEYVPFASEGYWQPILELFSRGVSARPRNNGPRETGRRIG